MKNKYNISASKLLPANQRVRRNQQEKNKKFHGQELVPKSSSNFINDFYPPTRSEVTVAALDTFISYASPNTRLRSRRLTWQHHPPTHLRSRRRWISVSIYSTVSSLPD